MDARILRLAVESLLQEPVGGGGVTHGERVADGAGAGFEVIRIDLQSVLERRRGVGILAAGLEETAERAEYMNVLRVVRREGAKQRGRAGEVPLGAEIFCLLDHRGDANVLDAFLLGGRHVVAHFGEHFQGVVVATYLVEQRGELESNTRRRSRILRQHLLEHADGVVVVAERGPGLRHHRDHVRLRFDLQIEREQLGAGP